MFRKASNSKEEWDNLLKFCLLAYRATPHAATGFSPYELIHGCPLRGPRGNEGRLGGGAIELQKLSGVGVGVEGHFSNDSPGSQ